MTALIHFLRHGHRQRRWGIANEGCVTCAQNRVLNAFARRRRDGF